MLDTQAISSYCLGMNKLPLETRAKILEMLCEGMSMRSVSRITDVSINTVTKLLVDAGTACAEYHEGHVRNVKAKRIQCDEIWSFCASKEKNTSQEKKAEGAGDVWTWTGLCADSKLIVSYLVGNRGAECAMQLMDDLRSRLANRVQLTTDGHKAYLEAVEGAFGDDIDFAQLIKIYGENTEGQKRYSPAECIGTKKAKIIGKPDLCCVSTSFVERQNLNIRMGVRRFTRLTNAFSKKLKNHFHMLAIYFMFYNFVRIHKTLKTTPAMAAGIETRLWDMKDLAQLVEDWQLAKRREEYGRAVNF